MHDETDPRMGLLIHGGEDGGLQTVSYPVHPGFPSAAAENGLQCLFVAQTVLDAIDLSTTFVLDGELHSRETGLLYARPVIEPSVSQTAIVADGVDAAVITGLPVPCTVYIDDEPYEVDDGELTFRTDEQAAYRVAIRRWPYAPFEVIIGAVEPEAA